jgi:hypothetical protein
MKPADLLLKECLKMLSISTYLLHHIRLEVPQRPGCLSIHQLLSKWH